MQTWHDFLGNPSVKEQLFSALTENKLSHSYILEGPKGSGKNTLSGLISASALCTGPRRPEDGFGALPCGRCPACRKGLGNHPDVIRITGSGVTGSIGVDAVRSVRADVYIRPNEGARKIYIVEQADKLTLQAQNALLLVFEEPPPYALFLLLCENAQKLLPTIRSRGVHLTLSPVSERECVSFLKNRGFSQEDAENAAAAAGNVIGQALALWNEGEGKPARACAVRFLRCLVSGSEHELLALGKQAAPNKPFFKAFLEAALEIIRDVMILKSGCGSPLYFRDETPLCQAAAAALTNGQVMDIMKNTEKSGARLDTNLSLSLGALVYMMQCWEATH